MPVPGGVVFCDDVRREESGKEIVIGIYANNIIVPQLPTVLPHLWSIATVTFDMDEEVSEVAMRLELPGGQEKKQQPIKVSPMQPPQEGQLYRYLKFRSHFEAVELPEPGFVRLFATIDGKDIRIGSLEVLEASKVIPQDPGGMLSSYFRRAAKEISERSSSREVLAAHFQEWAKEFASVLGGGTEDEKGFRSDIALVLPHPSGLKALFVRPLSPDEEINVTGLQSGNGWKVVERTQFAAVIKVERVPFPLNDVKIVARKAKLGTGRRQRVPKLR